MHTIKELFPLFLTFQIANVAMAMDDMKIDEETTYEFDFSFRPDAPACSNTPVPPKRRKMKGPPKVFGPSQKRGFDNYSESIRDMPPYEQHSEIANPKLIDDYLNPQT